MRQRVSCLFAILRVSSTAIDRLLTDRRELSRKRSRRKQWPNDESFVATTLAKSGFVVRDLNSFGQTLYSEETMSFFGPRQGEALGLENADVRLYHPVLFGADYNSKIERLERMARGENRFRRYGQKNHQGNQASVQVNNHARTADKALASRSGRDQKALTTRMSTNRSSCFRWIPLLARNSRASFTAGSTL